MSIDEWIEAYRLAWENRDPEAAAALFTEDCSYRENIIEEAHLGREGVARYWSNVTEAQSEVTVRMGRPFAQDDRVAVEFWTNMLVEGDPVTLPGCLLLDFDGQGLCRRLREYWHFFPGHHTPPPEWGE
ncbi:MAG: nuclear transport factor 2 family protein [Acidimicrobiia bacterium]|nr:nuclear transport factor 2 family protein [Acidimicrobiia bacterium]